MKRIPPLQTARARSLRNHPTDAERKLRPHLRDSQLGGHKFSRQVAIGPYICDFVCRRSRLIVELDGGQHADAAVYDQARTTYLELQGYRVLRFWNTDALTNMEGLIATLITAFDPCP